MISILTILDESELEATQSELENSLSKKHIYRER